jgi:hypothetical protein
VSVTVVTRHAKNMFRIILSPAAWQVLPHFSIVCLKRHDYGRRGNEHKSFVLSFSTNMSETSHILRRTEQDIFINVNRSSFTVPVILVRF